MPCITKYIAFAIVFLAIASLAPAETPEFRETQQPLSDYETVRRSMQFSLGPVGFGAVTAPVETAFRRMLHSPTATADFRKLISAGTTVGQLYALLGLKLLNDPTYATVAQRYKLSHSRVAYAGGCVISSMAVAEIAKHIDSETIK
jgi:hypothetical protein